MSQPVVRATELDDLDAVAAIMQLPGVRHGTLQMPYQPRDVYREHFARRSPDLLSLVAELDGRVVASGALRRQDRRRRHTGEVGMTVHDDYRGRGVGTALMATIVDTADNWWDLRRLQLTVFVDNAAGIALYRKFGFAVEGTLRDFAFRDGAYVDALLMARLRQP